MSARRIAYLPSVDEDSQDEDSQPLIAAKTSSPSARVKHRQERPTSVITLVATVGCTLVCILLVALGLRHALIPEPGAPHGRPIPKLNLPRASLTSEVQKMRSSPPPPPSPPPLQLGMPPQQRLELSMQRFSHILNQSLSWVRDTVPLFECDDSDITMSYWYRWRLFNMHMRKRPAKAPGCGKAGGCWVITEFLNKVFWSGPYNTIVCPAVWPSACALSFPLGLPAMT